jgi:diguanylate cyclase (GGDEF)-like protein/PAS domain S-box-containing protein
MEEITEPALTTTLGVDPALVSAALVESMGEYVALFNGDMRVVGANRTLCHALGYAVEDLLGRSALDLVAPGNRDRAGVILGIAERQGTMGGTAPFDLLRADGSILTIHVTGSDLLIDGQQVLSVIGRPAHETIAIGLVLDRLLASEHLGPVLEPLLDLFAWRLAGSGVAITWSTDGIRHSVSTALPDGLTGVGELHPDGPWAKALALGEPVHASVDHLLDLQAQAQARALHLGQIWVEPIATVSATPDAMITVLTAEGGYPPLVHRFGVDEARRYLAVVLRWSDALRRLEDAARRDDLTGLANRRTFFDELSAADGGGAILFADLDEFKAVNDRWGHSAGDAVLREVGQRIVAAVDPSVCVARVGGDEFAVILPGASADNAGACAEQIRHACAEPYDIDGAVVSLGISVGVAHDPTDLGSAALHAADRDQYVDKRRRSTDT